MQQQAPSLTLPCAAGIRKTIAETYEDRAVKYDAYVTKFEVCASLCQCQCHCQAG